MKNKHKYRGQLNNGEMVDIFDFDGRVAKCDHGQEDLDVNEFNCIFFPRDTFKEFFDIVDKSPEQSDCDELEEHHKKTQKKK